MHFFVCFPKEYTLKQSNFKFFIIIILHAANPTGIHFLVWGKNKKKHNLVYKKIRK